MGKDQPNAGTLFQKLNVAISEASVKTCGGTQAEELNRAITGQSVGWREQSL